MQSEIDKLREISEKPVPTKTYRIHLKSGNKVWVDAIGMNEGPIITFYESTDQYGTWNPVFWFNLAEIVWIEDLTNKVQKAESPANADHP